MRSLARSFATQPYAILKLVRIIVTAACVGGVLLEPAALNAQTFSFQSSTQQSTTVLRARTWTFPTAEPTAASISETLASGVRESNSSVDTETLRALQPRAQLRTPRLPKGTARQHSRSYRDTQRVLAAFALGFVGFYAGGVTAFGIAEHCSCMSEGGVYLGAGIGAAVGATAGWLLVR